MFYEKNMYMSIGVEIMMSFFNFAVIPQIHHKMAVCTNVKVQLHDKAFVRCATCNACLLIMNY